MALIIADRVKETSTTTGSGSLTLLGAVTGYVAFDTPLNTADTTFYAIVHQAANEWEVGVGTFTAPSTLARTTVLASSNAGAAVVFSAGTKDVFITAAAAKLYFIGGPDVAVADGGTGLSVGTSGGVLAFTATGVLASSAALDANQLILGGGAGVVPATLGSLGTTTTVLHGNAAGAPTFSAVATADITNDAVTYAKIQNVSVTDRLLGRSTAGAGDVEEIACTAAGRALLDDVAASDQRTTLGLGTLATQSGTFSGTSSGTNTGDNAAASTTVVGTVELATDAETQTGTDTTRAVTPSNITAKEATTAQYLANTADRILTTDLVWAAGVLTALTDGATITPDFSLGINFSVTLGGNRTLANPTNTKVGQSGSIVVTQDATGTRTLAYGTNWEFAGGTAVVLTTTANAKDILYYWVQSATSIIITGIQKALA